MLDVLDAWEEEILPVLAERSIPTYSILTVARPVELGDNRLLLLFPPNASFHCRLAREEAGALLQELLFDLTGRKPGLYFCVSPDVDTSTKEDV